MPRLSKRQRDEWAFFIHPRTGRRTYNEICRRCVLNCKQSFRATLVRCPHYYPRSKCKGAKQQNLPLQDGCTKERRELLKRCFKDRIQRRFSSKDAPNHAENGDGILNHVGAFQERENHLHRLSEQTLCTPPGAKRVDCRRMPASSQRAVYLYSQQSYKHLVRALP